MTGKLRPWLIIQNNEFLHSGQTVTVCMVTTGSFNSNFRLPVMPSEVNGLDAPSQIMVDKVMTLRRSAIRQVIGDLEAVTMRSVEEALRLAGETHGKDFSLAYIEQPKAPVHQGLLTGAN